MLSVSYFFENEIAGLDDFESNVNDYMANRQNQISQQSAINSKIESPAGLNDFESNVNNYMSGLQNQRSQTQTQTPQMNSLSASTSAGLNDFESNVNDYMANRQNQMNSASQNNFTQTHQPSNMTSNPQQHTSVGNQTQQNINVNAPTYHNAGNIQHPQMKLSSPINNQTNPATGVYGGSFKRMAGNFSKV